MFEQLMIVMQKEPIASAILLMIAFYFIIKATGLSRWIDKKIYGEEDESNFNS